MTSDVKQEEESADLKGCINVHELFKELFSGSRVEIFTHFLFNYNFVQGHKKPHAGKKEQSDVYVVSNVSS